MACWSSYDAWEAEGKPDILDRAAERCAQRLQSAPDDLLDSDLNRALAAFAEDASA